jgi:Ser/Thr protein kinase RdoA (MazF antagonist)
MGGRSPDELAPEQLLELGRLLGRIHNVTASLGLRHRPTLSPETYGLGCLETILERAALPPGLRGRYDSAVRRLIDVGVSLWVDLETFPIHADCHKGNLLFGREGWFFLDFDDMAVGPPAQDFWLLLPARPADCPRELEALVAGYETMRDFDRRTIALVEVLRGLRYVRYAAWVTQRWDDPSFPRAFPHFGTEGYWEQQCADLTEQLMVLGV